MIFRDTIYVLALANMSDIGTLVGLVLTRQAGVPYPVFRQENHYEETRKDYASDFPLNSDVKVSEAVICI